MKSKSLSLIMGLLMLVALAGALLLMKQNQNTERGAYFAGTNLLMQPGEVTGNVGDTILVQLYADTEKIITGISVGGSSTSTPNDQLNCVEACPNSSQKNLLQSCTPPDSDGSSDDSLCNTAGIVEGCGGQNYCCPSVGGQWTTTMTACGGGCGVKPVEQCVVNANEGSRLRVRPVCTSGNWDFEDQLCDSVGRKDVCGGQNYCCPSVGGQWTTDMAACETRDIYAKISSIDTVVCYGSNLSITDLATQIVLNEEALKTKIDISSETVDGKTCLRLVAISDAKPEDLKGGMVKLATIRFKGVTAGTGKIEYLADKTKLGGYNPVAGATDMALKLGTATGATYTVGAGSTGCNLTVNPPRLCPPGFYCQSSGSADGADGVCIEGCETNADCPSGQECYQPPMPTCPAGANCIQALPHKICRVVTTDAPILNYQVSYGNTKVGDAKCVVDWPMRIIVLSRGESKAYDNVKPSLVSNNSDRLVFAGSLPLVGFNKLDRVAAFFKGPKHIQMKYATQNQGASYEKAGGELVLTTNPATSISYNFSAYPMIPGDVVGRNTETPDGWIDGIDFAYVKSKALTHDTVAEGNYIKADLDGNCQVNSNDVNVLKISLQTKQGQLY